MNEFFDNKINEWLQDPIVFNVDYSNHITHRIRLLVHINTSKIWSITIVGNRMFYKSHSTLSMDSLE